MNGWVNNREAGDLRRRRAHYEITVMHILFSIPVLTIDANMDVFAVHGSCGYDANMEPAHLLQTILTNGNYSFNTET